MTSGLASYSAKYTRARLRREGGVLELVLHDGSGGSLVWDEAAHRELPDLFADIARDADNHVVILTGSGSNFCASIDRASWPDSSWEKIFTEGRRLLENLLNIDVPMIAAVNGPARWHAELAVLCDIVLASILRSSRTVPIFRTRCRVMACTQSGRPCWDQVAAGTSS